MNRDRLVAGVLLVPLFVGILFSFAKLMFAHTHVPDAADYTAARAALVAQGYDRAHDALAVLPPWSLRPYTALGDLEPISGDALSKRPLHRHRRLFVLVEPDPSSEHAALQARLGPPAWSQDIGRVRLQRWDIGGEGVRYDFTERLFDATPRAGKGAQQTACDARRADGWACPGRPDWQRFSRMWLLVSENADYAIWTHPAKGGDPLEAVYEGVPIGNAIVVRAGHTREGADLAKAPVRIHVKIDDEEVAVVQRDVAFDFRTDEIDTKRFAGRTARVGFAIETDDDSMQHFAWDAYVVGGPK